MPKSLTSVKNATAKFVHSPVVLYALGVAAGVSVTTLVVAGMPAGILTITQEQAKNLMSNPEQFVIFQRVGRNMAVRIATTV
jgi:hypothetical protein